MIKMRESARYITTTKISNRKIANTLGLSHTTVGKYRKKLTESGLDWPTIDKLSDGELESLLNSTRKNTTYKRPPDLPYLEEQMRLPDMTLYTLWEAYRVSDPVTAYSFSSFADKFQKYKRKVDLSMRQTHKAGECVFVDFAGRNVPIRDVNESTKYNAQIFVGAFGASNYTFVYAVKSQKLPDWIEAHNRMFQYFGGTPEVVVPDNLKSAVTRAGREPLLNRTYLELCKYYNIVVAPARANHPKDKSKAEVAVQIVTRWILVKLRNRIFFSIEELNRAISELLWELNERPFKKLPGCRRSRFEQLDKPLLRPIPGEPFEYAEWSAKQKVVSEYHVYIDKHYYSVPYELVGCQVEARIASKTIEIFHEGKRVATHVRSRDQGGHTTIPAHQPKSHREYAELTPDNMRHWANKIGKGASAVVQHQFREGHSIVLGLRACSSLKRLAHEYGAEQFEKACQRAQLIGSLTKTSVKSILKRGLTDLPSEGLPIQIQLPLHHNVRGSSYYS